MRVPEIRSVLGKRTASDETVLFVDNQTTNLLCYKEVGVDAPEWIVRSASETRFLNDGSNSRPFLGNLELLAERRSYPGGQMAQAFEVETGVNATLKKNACYIIAAYLQQIGLPKIVLLTGDQIKRVDPTFTVLKVSSDAKNLRILWGMIQGTTLVIGVRGCDQQELTGQEVKFFQDTYKFNGQLRTISIFSESDKKILTATLAAFHGVEVAFCEKMNESEPPETTEVEEYIETKLAVLREASTPTEIRCLLLITGIGTSKRSATSKPRSREPALKIIPVEADSHQPENGSDLSFLSGSCESAGQDSTPCSTLPLSTPQQQAPTAPQGPMAGTLNGSPCLGPSRGQQSSFHVPAGPLMSPAAPKNLQNAHSNDSNIGGSIGSSHVGDCGRTWGGSSGEIVSSAENWDGSDLCTDGSDGSPALRSTFAECGAYS